MRCVVLCCALAVATCSVQRDSLILNAFTKQVNGKKEQCRFLAQFQKNPFDKAGLTRCKWSPSDEVERVRSKLPCQKPLFITGVGYSGTHFTASSLNVLMNISASHEKSSSRSLVDVSWFARYDVEWLFGDGTATPYLEHAGDFFHPGYDAQPASRECMYQTVLHQVRHPLKVLASILHHTSGANSITQETINPNRQVWAHIMGRTPVPKSAWYREDGHFLRNALERAMLHYITWNYLVEQAADARYRVEDFDAQMVCSLAAGDGLGPCTPRLHHSRAEAIIALRLRSFSHQGERNPVTWEMLSRTNEVFAEHIWTMAQRYGYSRLPPPKPTTQATIVTSSGKVVELPREILEELSAQAKQIHNKEMLSLLMAGPKAKGFTGSEMHARALRIATDVVREYSKSYEAEEL